MNIDIVELVKNSLAQNGCDEKLLNNFDGHSTIELHFEDMPNILINQLDENVLLWARLSEHNQHIISQCSERILSLLLEPAAYSITRQFQLGEDDGYTVMKCILHPSAANPTDFGEALEEFFLRMEQFMEILR